MEEAAVGLEEGCKAGTSEADLLEDHRQGDLFTTCEDLGELGLDFLVRNLGESERVVKKDRRRRRIC